jgi:hypothetical protein
MGWTSEENTWGQSMRVVNVQKGPYRSAAGVTLAGRYEGDQRRRVV